MKDIFKGVIIKVVSIIVVAGLIGLGGIFLYNYFTNNILNNSDLPLAILGRLGFFSFIISILMIIYYIARYFIFGLSVQGFTTIVVLLLALGGLILFGIGLIGRYMIQLNSEVKKIPNYVIRSKEVD